MGQKNISILISLIALAGCHQSEAPPPVEYTGPLREAADVSLLYSEKDRIKVKMKAKKILEFKNGDQEFPDGLYLEFYNEKGAMTSTLKANQAYFFKEENKWRGRGNVEVRNIEKQQELNSEELFWKPDTKKIFTDKFVTIKLESEVIYGVGLDAAQDLSYYTIKDPKGEILIKD
ncbi:MAG TPA: LPS export ABC transporter periplasmic protein LptC [Cyclobacteriaceae bacterium]|nr:LPS export ABC transporter periplasmic protein LptC [Cyclobacteriaceae bacterium]